MVHNRLHHTASWSKIDLKQMGKKIHMLWRKKTKYIIIWGTRNLSKLDAFR